MKIMWIFSKVSLTFLPANINSCDDDCLGNGIDGEALLLLDEPDIKSLISLGPTKTLVARRKIYMKPQSLKDTESSSIEVHFPHSLYVRTCYMTSSL